MTNRTKHTFTAFTLALTLAATACSMRVDEKGEGKEKRVEIETPAGELKVRTNEEADVKEIGLPAYPGARPAKDEDESGAHVSIATALFGLKVVAAKFESDDSPQKVLAFYRPHLEKYGKGNEWQGDVEMVFVDVSTARAMSERVYEAVDQAQAVIAAVYVTPTSGKRVRGTKAKMAGIPDAHAALLHGILQRARARTVVVALGSPYLAGDFPEVENYLCTFSGMPVSEMSAVKALFGEMSIRGKMPVSIPEVAERGSGIEVPVRSAPITQAVPVQALSR